MAGAGDDASPRPNFDKSPMIADGQDVSTLMEAPQVRARNQIKGVKATAE